MPILSLVNIAVAFIAGFLTFFAGCLTPVVPVYLSFLAGSAPSQKVRSKIIINSLWFIIGFIGVFLILGLTAQLIGKLLAPYQLIISRAAGALLILFGLHITGFLKFTFLYKHRAFSPAPLPRGTAFGSLLLGLIFGLSWTPCIGPVLASILFWTASQHTFIQGAVLMLAFSLGLALPFLTLGILFETVFRRVQSIERFAPAIKLVSGTVLIVVGLLLVGGHFGYVSSFFLKRIGPLVKTVEFAQ